MKKVLAIDMGATSIRAILAYIENSTLKTREVMRLNHDLQEKDKRLRWQWDKLINQIVSTIKEYSSEIDSVAVDTWGVDFGYLDEFDNLINYPISYRDPKHEEAHKEAIKLIDEDRIFTNTGTQIMNINTLFQLLSLRKENPLEFQKIKKILMLPDLISYLLCGKMIGEETILSTTSLMNLETKEYSKEILDIFQIDKSILPKINKSCEIMGSTKNSKIESLRAYDIKVISVCGHDTASAVLLTKAFSDNDYMFLSCGTWSLLGAKVDKANLSKKAYEKNLTNELSYESTTLLFKNITGLYLLEKYKKELENLHNKKIEFADITKAVKNSILENQENSLLIDMDDARFADPYIKAKDAIDSYLIENNMKSPKDEMEYFRVIYESLVCKYLETKLALEEILNKTYKNIHIIGGGAKSDLLCELIAKKLNINIIAGPYEASALGNILLQLKALGEIKDINEGLEIINKTQEIKYYKA